ncbi:MAG: 50S ribosomal protein L9 [Planctomycetota bacterium]|jgi:large subunit ribosomal protein L9
MKVLLCEDVASVGWLGDVVDVKDGYARNYLIPQGIAKMATESNIKAIAEEKAKRAELRIQEEKHIEEAAKKVEGAEAVIAAKANEQGHLFGSVGPKEIAENLRAQGYEVANEIVQLQENIKEVGTHQVSLKFTDELLVSVQVTVVAETADEEQTESE